MPIYAYRCERCGHAKDVLQKVSDPMLTVCPACGEPTFRKQVTAAGFQLKGSGWYVTDFRGDKPAGKSTESGTDGDAKPADSKNADSKNADAKSGDAKGGDAKGGDAATGASSKANGSTDGAKASKSEAPAAAPPAAKPAAARPSTGGSNGGDSQP